MRTAYKEEERKSAKGLRGLVVQAKGKENEREKDRLGLKGLTRSRRNSSAEGKRETIGGKRQWQAHKRKRDW